MSQATKPHKTTIVLAGDPGVGKTTLVYSWISQQFREVPHVIQRVKVPGDLTFEKRNLAIVDTSSVSSALGDSGETTLQIQRAHVVILVCTPDRQSLTKIRNVWLPKIASVSDNRPNRAIRVIVAANKIDWINETTSTSLEHNTVIPSSPTHPSNWRVHYEDIIHEILHHELVEKFIDVSAKHWNSVQRLFLTAQHVVIYPLAPIYDAQTEELKPRFRRALLRLFRMSDGDGDGLLSNIELNHFQETCFENRLDSDQISEIKRTLQNRREGNILQDFVTFEGFMDLLKMCIEKNRPNIIWAAIRKFGYNDDIILTRDYLRQTFPKTKSNRNKKNTYELTDYSLDFLRKTFRSFDKDEDGGLADQELREIFRVFDIVPEERFDRFVSSFHITTDSLFMFSRTDHGYIDLNGWLSVWAALTIRDPELVNECLAYLGVARDQLIFRCIRQTGSVRCIVRYQKVLQCLVFSSSNRDKMLLFHRITNPNSDDEFFHKIEEGEGLSPRIAVNKLTNCRCSYVFLRDLDYDEGDHSVERTLRDCDVVLLIANDNDPTSLRRAHRLLDSSLFRKFCDGKIPVVLIRSTDLRAPLNELELAQQKQRHLQIDRQLLTDEEMWDQHKDQDLDSENDQAPLSIDLLMKRFSLSEVQPFPQNGKFAKRVFRGIVRLCENPKAAKILPCYSSGSSRGFVNGVSFPWLPLFGIGTIVGVYMAYCWFFKKSNSSHQTKQNKSNTSSSRLRVS